MLTTTPSPTAATLGALLDTRSGQKDPDSAILPVMADAAPPGDPVGARDSAVLLEVTVVPGPRGGTRRSRLRLLRRLGPALAALAVFAGAVVGVAVSGLSGAKQPVHAQALQAGDAGPAGVAAAYHYPLACLSVTISLADPAYAAARLNRASPCWRYGVYATTIFHRVAGEWRLVTSSTGCSIASIPAVVRGELGVCDGGPPDGLRAVLNDWDLPRALGSNGSEG